MLETLLHFLRSLYDPEGLKELIRSGAFEKMMTAARAAMATADD